MHGHRRVDPYFWLRERDHPDVVRYLQEENAYTEALMLPTRELQETLFREIKDRIKPDDRSVPYRRDGYFYYHRFEAGNEYAVHCRKRGSLDAPEEILVDANELAVHHDYFSLELAALSLDTKKLAYAMDTEGRRFYTVRFKDLETGAVLPDVLQDVTGNLAFANDNRTVFYTKQHPETLRSYRLYRHVVGTEVAEDVLVYEEEDETFDLHVYKSKSRRYLMLVASHALTTEYRFLPADEPEGAFTILEPRIAGREYSVSHFGEHFYILTNQDALNFRLVKAPVSSPGAALWEDVLAHREEVLLEDFEIFRDFLVVVERREGLPRIRLLPWEDLGAGHEIVFPDPAYDASLMQNLEFETDTVRYTYASLVTPRSVYDYDMRSRTQNLLKRDEIVGGYDPGSYRSERITATAADGARVPISLVYRKDTTLEGKPPLLLYGYGSYGITVDPTFSSTRLSLLDRGFVFAIAHVRGSETLGRKWYDDGRLLSKRNSFTDFIASAEHLAAEGYAHPDRIYAWGASAGGLLVGAVINMRSDLFRGVVAHVPFVDIVTTMLDDTIPLTTGEYDEWGNPHERELYEYMLSYSPYDNVERKDYPHLLVTAGYNDSQVQYWEPAKWVAKLRAMKTNDRRLLLKTNLEAGHHGESGRFRQHRETALAYAFLLDLEQME